MKKNKHKCKYADICKWKCEKMHNNNFSTCSNYRFFEGNLSLKKKEKENKSE